jgi:hypothetical protein
MHVLVEDVVETREYADSEDVVDDATPSPQMPTGSIAESPS